MDKLMGIDTESKYIFNFYKKENYRISEDITWEIDGSQSVDEICEKFQRFIYSTQSYLAIDSEPTQLEFNFA